MVRTDILKAKIDESGIKYKKIAETLDISIKTLYNKMRGTTDFSVIEAKALAELIGLNTEESNQIFFA